MKKQIWPVVLYCGWFLMVPPVVGGKVAKAAPIAQWTHWKSFDTSKDCEEYFGQMSSEYLGSRCLPADSIPLK